LETEIRLLRLAQSASALKARRHAYQKPSPVLLLLTAPDVEGKFLERMLDSICTRRFKIFFVVGILSLFPNASHWHLSCYYSITGFSRTDDITDKVECVGEDPCIAYSTECNQHQNQFRLVEKIVF
jgi:hypothetical protein